MLTSDRVERALVFAATKHAGQRRKGTDIPYVTHPVSVALLVNAHGGSEEQIIGALLHDTVEDCGGLPVLEEIEAAFGAGVARIVHWCTDSFEEEEKRPWRERKEHHVTRLGEAPDDVALVAVCDKLHNAKSVLASYQEIGEELWKRFRGGKDGSLWYYRAMADLFERRAMGPVSTELDAVVRKIESLAGIST